MTILMFIYHFVWTFIALSLFPLIPFFKNPRFFERTALSLPGNPPGCGSIWIHALSVGEILAAIPLVRAIKKRYPEKDIVFTVTTTQAMKIARNELAEDVSFLLTMPLDFWWSVRRMMTFVRPSIFILIETDVWPGLIFHLKKHGIPTVLINGRISPRTFRSYKRFGYFTRLILSTIEICLMQSDLDSERLLRIGLGPDKVKTVGNIKFDRDWIPMGEKEYTHWMEILNLNPEDDVWVAGSTHQGEEEILLDIFGKLQPLFPTLRLIIAPREIERTKDIFKMSVGMGFKTVLRTEVDGNRKRYDVMILNTLGELDRIYGIGKISFVGGSLIPIGGHNLLEPAWFGHPVLFGPYTHNFVRMSQLLLEAGGGKRVGDGEELFNVIKGLLSDTEERKGMGGRAKEFVEINRGALEKVMGYLKNYLENVTSQ